ncbi:hypothetical protein ACIQU5_28275 [Streptomyces sp. NPDC090306]|uniref:hypothetical protein n=1 Tax=unclassified Streptomyces TaxID=2593676 RepID=UPI0036E16F7A
MFSTRRIVAAVGLAASVTALAAPMASAETQGQDAAKLNPVTALDTIASTGLPADRQGELPRISDQLSGLNHLNDLNQLHQLTDLAAPVTGLLPGIQA